MRKFNIVTILILISFKTFGQIPVTDKPINNSDEVFRFAVVSDRTGGMQAGIFKEAIDKVNLMQPEFVLSVGDLIDGYTENPKVWSKQWDELDSIVNRLDMPFYHVPGNHDTSNKLLTEVWRERLGRDYYHFKYKNVLFAAINTDEIEGGGIGPEQIEYFEKVLSENSNVEWTLLFMHRPVWSYQDRLGYDNIENALGDRNYTVFSGHHHHYRYKRHNGMEHYTLATSGGGSNLRGIDVGEFHHITWITMKETGPKLAHLELSGILDKNVVAEEDYEDIQTLRKGKWLNVAPYVHHNREFKEIEVNLEFENKSNRPLILSGRLNSRQDLVLSPQEVADTLMAKTKKEVKVRITASKTPISIQSLNNAPIEFEMQAGIVSSVGKIISLETQKDLQLDWIHKLRAIDTTILLDGNLAEWPKKVFIEVINPQYLQEGWDWEGKDDGNFSFAALTNGKKFYLSVQFLDDLIISSKDIADRQDKFYVHLESNNKTLEIELAAGTTPEKPLINWGKGKKRSISAAITQNAHGQVLELEIPIKHLIPEGEQLKSIRLNVGVMDHDRTDNTKPSILWWRPLWNTNDNYIGSGFFRRE